MWIRNLEVISPGAEYNLQVILIPHWVVVKIVVHEFEFLREPEEPCTRNLFIDFNHHLKEVLIWDITSRKPSEEPRRERRDNDFSFEELMIFVPNTQVPLQEILVVTERKPAFSCIALLEAWCIRSTSTPRRKSDRWDQVASFGYMRYVYMIFYQILTLLNIKFSKEETPYKPFSTMAANLGRNACCILQTVEMKR